jgi:hypothetical protein
MTSTVAHLTPTPPFRCVKTPVEKPKPSSHLHGPPIHPRPTPQATIEAIMFCVRDRGISALKAPENIVRLRTCDRAARTQINNRIARLSQDRAHGQ